MEPLPNTYMSIINPLSSAVRYESNFIVFLGFCFRFTENMFILKDNSVRNERICSLNADVDCFGDFPYFEEDAKPLSQHN